MRTGRHAAGFIHCILAAAAGTGTTRAADPAPERFAFESKHMGTLFELTLYAPTRDAAESAAKAAFRRIAELDKTLSDYDPGSEAMTVCRQAAGTPGTPFIVGDDLFAVLTAADRVSRQTGGAFDATVGPLTKLWRLTRRTQVLPDPAELAAARAKVGYAKLTLDPGHNTVAFAVPGMQLDFGGIAKGFAADEVVKLLRARHQLTAVLVAAGGDITAADPPPGQPGWLVDIRPLAAGRPARRLTLANAAVSTSGDLDQVALVNGVRHSHVLDPKTGLGLTGRRSVTVIAPTGTLADSLTKAASVLPAADAVKLIDTIPGAAVYSVVRDPETTPEVETASQRFADFLAKP